MSQLPRVSEILRATGLGPDLSMVPAVLLEVARRRGSAVHAAVEGLVYRYDVETPPEAAPYVDAFKKFLVDSTFEPIAAEILVIHPSWRYQGHPDVIGFLSGHRGILDVKTGASDGAAYQVAAYVDAWSAQRPTEPATWGAILHLRDDGTYRFDEIDLARSLETFRAAVLVYHAQTARRAISINEWREIAA